MHATLLQVLDDFEQMADRAGQAVEADDDPAWALLRIAASRQAQAARIMLCASPGPGLLELAARHGAQTLSRPPAPSKLRSLLAQRPLQALRGAA